jgi:hypothetical protein
MSVYELRAALERIAQQQPRTLDGLVHYGVVFRDIGNDPLNWQHIAFSLYTDLCEVDWIARSALADDAEVDA